MFRRTITILFCLLVLSLFSKESNAGLIKRGGFNPASQYAVNTGMIHPAVIQHEFGFQAGPGNVHPGIVQPGFIQPNFVPPAVAGHPGYMNEFDHRFSNGAGIFIKGISVLHAFAILAVGAILYQ